MEGQRGDHPRYGWQQQLQRVGRIEDRFFIFLQIPVVGQWQAFQGSQQTRQITDEAAGLASSKFGNVAGSIVRSGEIKRGSRARITRDGVVVENSLDIASLRRFKDDVTEVRDGFECGINLGSFNDLQVGDLITTYEMREKPRA